MGDIEINLDKSTECKLKIKLFQNVTNVEDIRQRIISGKLDCCVIKPTLIIDPMQIIIAANKAAVSQKQNTLVTRTVYSEILFNLSITKNVTKSLTTFGIDDKHTTILVAVVYKIGDDRHCEDIFQEIEGDKCDIQELVNFVDYNLVKKTYGITDSSNNHLLNKIVNKIVMKEC